LQPIRVLVVEDHGDFRKLVRLLLQDRPEWQIIFEASDGYEAVEKARELRPDLILMDIGLSKLNGIEAARRIRQHSPKSKIIFVSMDDAPEVVRTALSTGAQGYVYKARIQSDLVPAIDAVLRGIQFAPTMFRDRISTDDAISAKAPHHHEVQFYSDDKFLLDRLVRFITFALNTGDVAIVVATESHRERLRQRLKSEGMDIDTAIKEGRYISVDAVATLSLFMINDMPDSSRFIEIVGCLIEQATKTRKTEHPRVAIFGEWASLLFAEGKSEAVIRLEQLGNQLATIYEVDIFCGYALSGVHDEVDGQVLLRICAEHSAVHIL
jgi:DNA-binding NarL/FixJ family response regulator